MIVPLKVMTIVGTRPEIIKLSRVIAALEKHTQHVLVHTDQNYDYELNEIFFKDLEIKKPDYFLATKNTSAIEMISQVLIKVDEVITIEKPDAVLVYGDTNSCLAAITAKRRRVPIFHMEAGNRCFDQRTPEEINRKIIDHISDVNLTISEHARNYLLSEGLRPEKTFKIGSTMKEILNHYNDKIQQSTILKVIAATAKEYFLISLHREENIDYDHNFNEIVLLLNTIAETFDKQIIVSTHPRTRVKLEQKQKIVALMNKKIKFLKPFSFSDYIKLQMNAYCILSDSGSLTEDASILDLPAITLRTTHERPEGMDVGTLIMSGLKHERVIQAIQFTTTNHFSQSLKRKADIVPDYNVDNVSQKVVKIILSYTDYINDTVWHRNMSS